MDYTGIWEDCMNKLEDLGFDIDNLSEEIIPTFPLNDDKVVGPIMVAVMRDVRVIWADNG